MSASQIHITIPEGVSDRLDKSLAALMPEQFALSRTRIQELIASEAVFLEGQGAINNPKHKVTPGEIYRIDIPPAKPLGLIAQNIPIDIIYEDADLLVVNKASGMIVHKGRGAEDGTLVNALLYHCGDTLSGIGGVERPGIVHRIDKDTSGLLVVAKHDRAHEGLGKQFRAHSIHRVYQAFCYGVPSLGEARLFGMNGISAQNGDIRVDLPIGRHKTDRLRMAVRDDGKRAVTYIRPIDQDESGSIAKVECRLETGRTHQIRVHMTHIGFPLLGDPIYGRGARQLSKEVSPKLVNEVGELTGQALHAAELGFVHPVSGEEMRFEVEAPKGKTLNLHQ